MVKRVYVKPSYEELEREYNRLVKYAEDIKNELEYYKMKYLALKSDF